jgi:hypothetical protein
VCVKKPDDGRLRPKHVKYTRRIEIYKITAKTEERIVIFTIPHNMTLKYHIYTVAVVKFFFPFTCKIVFSTWNIFLHFIKLTHNLRLAAADIHIQVFRKQCCKMCRVWVTEYPSLLYDVSLHNVDCRAHMLCNI